MTQTATNHEPTDRAGDVDRYDVDVLVDDYRAALGGRRVEVSIAEAAELLGLTRMTIRRAIQRGELPAGRIRRNSGYRIRLRALARWRLDCERRVFDELEPPTR